MFCRFCDKEIDMANVCVDCILWVHNLEKENEALKATTRLKVIADFEVFRKWCKFAEWCWHPRLPGEPGKDNYAFCGAPENWDDDCRSHMQCTENICPAWRQDDEKS